MILREDGDKIKLVVLPLSSDMYKLSRQIIHYTYEVANSTSYARSLILSKYAKI